jgi:hypothetical protein
LGALWTPYFRMEEGQLFSCIILEIDLQFAIPFSNGAYGAPEPGAFREGNRPNCLSGNLQESVRLLQGMRGPSW